MAVYSDISMAIFFDQKNLEIAKLAIETLLEDMELVLWNIIEKMFSRK